MTDPVSGMWGYSGTFFFAANSRMVNVYAPWPRSWNEVAVMR